MFVLIKFISKIGSMNTS